jgi:hypothetical protein
VISIETALTLSARLLGLFAVVQGYEFLRLRRIYSDRGVWRWADLEREIGAGSALLARLLGVFLRARAFWGVNVARLLIGLLAFVWPTTWMVALLLCLHVLTLWRWRGSYNGGSDYMNLLVLIGVSAGLYFPHHPRVAEVALWYIAVQLALSYAKAGWSKLKVACWRRGEALGEFLSSRDYERSVRWERVLNVGAVALAVSWALMLFEISFPLSFLHADLALVYAGAALFFHLGNAYFFGLNRFFWAWLCAYPALLHCV